MYGGLVTIIYMPVAGTTTPPIADAFLLLDGDDLLLLDGDNFTLLE